MDWQKLFFYFRIEEVAQCHRLLLKAGCTAQSGEDSFFPVLEIQDVVLDLDFSISDPVFLTQKIVFKLGNMIRDVHCSTRILIFTHPTRLM
jgi:hypothetical protein